jgi:hypothetical protein
LDKDSIIFEFNSEKVMFVKLKIDNENDPDLKIKYNYSDNLVNFKVNGKIIQVPEKYFLEIDLNSECDGDVQQEFKSLNKDSKKSSTQLFMEYVEEFKMCDLD